LQREKLKNMVRWNVNSFEQKQAGCSQENKEKDIVVKD
jgi:hypothetical protein